MRAKVTQRSRATPYKKLVRVYSLLLILLGTIITYLCLIVVLIDIFSNYIDRLLLFGILEIPSVCDRS